MNNLTSAFEILIQAGPLLGKGLLSTLVMWIGALLIAFTVGTVWGALRSAPFRQPYLSTLLNTITFVLRGIPFYVQLLLAYFVIPSLINIDISANTAGIWTLGLCSAAYVSQIIQGGINALDTCQIEAAKVLGYSKTQTLYYIVIPQTLKNVFPSLVGEFDQALKTTAVFSTVGVLELTGAAKNIIAQEMNPITMYSAIALMYLCLSSALALGMSLMKKKYWSGGKNDNNY